MHICHITSVHPRDDVRIFYKECITLSKIYDRITLVVADGKGEMTVGNITVYDVGKPKDRYDRILFTARKIYKKVLELNPDAVHFHDPELMFVAGRLKKKINAKIVYDIHEDFPRQILTKHWIPYLFRKPTSVLAEILENRQAKKFDQLLTSTDFIRDRFLKLNPNTVTLFNYPIIKEFAGINIDWDKKERAICYIGNLTKERGIVELVRAMRYTDNVKLYLAGRFANSQFKRYVKEQPGWDKVEFLGFVDREGIRNILAKSKIGLVTLHPTLNYLDSLPVKMFEYMSANLPVISSDFPLWKSIVDENDIGLCVDPHDSKLIASCIMYLIDDQERCMELGNNGRRAMFEKYNWEQQEKRLLSTYAKLLGTRSIFAPASSRAASTDKTDEAVVTNEHRR